MIITDIKVHLLKKSLASAMNISRGGFTERYHAIVELITDAGISGYGEGIGNAPLVKSIIETNFCARMIGQNPFNIEKIRSNLLENEVYFERAGSTICAASAIEMACWDIKGKALGLPVYDLLGGKVHETLDVYASDIYWEQEPSKMADNAMRIVDLGYNTIKVHIGADTPRNDAKRLQSIRNAVGYDIEMMVDLNAGYNYLDATTAIAQWKNFNIKWLEEPLDPEHSPALSDLRRKSDIPIAAGENIYRLYGFHESFRQHMIDVAMPDIGRVGGLLETKSICTLADAFGIPVSPHCFSSGILLAATIHLMASCKNCILLEMDTSNNAVYDELIDYDLDISDSSITVPDCVGLGVTVNKEILEKYAVN